MLIDDNTLVWNGGEEFIDARDCAYANVAALQAASPKNGVYNVCPGSLITFADYLAAACAALPGLQLDIKSQPKGGFGGFPLIRETPSDVTLARQELGFSCRYSLAETLRYYID